MPSQFPLRYEVNAEATEGISSIWKAQTNALAPTSCAIPPEFNGPGGAYSPEDFFALAILNCMIASFKFHCEKAGQHFEKIKGNASLSITKDPETEHLLLNEVYIKFDVSGSSDAGHVKNLLEQAIKECPVGNAVKTGKSFQINVK